MSAFDDSSAALSLLQLATVPPKPSDPACSLSKRLFSTGDSTDPVVLSDEEDFLTSSSNADSNLSAPILSSSPPPPPVSPSPVSKSISITIEDSHPSTAKVANELSLGNSTVLSAAPRIKFLALGVRRSLVPFHSQPFSTPRDVPVSTRPKRVSAPFSSATAPKRLGIGNLSLICTQSVASFPNSKQDSNKDVIEECLTHVGVTFFFP